MRYFTRRKVPIVLTELMSKHNPLPRWEHWGKQFAANRQNNKSFPFQWPEVEGTKLNHLLLDDLKGQTDKHCSYCDNFPLTKGNYSIDHFKPKKDFHVLVCAWENLYYACGHCQAPKLEKFDPLLLRPDEENFNFHDYFEVNVYTQQISILPKLTSGSRAHQQAMQTITLLDLNNTTLVQCRKREFERYFNRPRPELVADQADPLKLPEPDAEELAEFAFRFMFDF